MRNTGLLTARNIRKSYPGADGPIPVLHDVSLAIDRAESVALTGESGSGKSTLLHILGGLDDIDSGSVVLDGASISQSSDAGRAEIRRSRVGVVFQQFNLIPSIDAAANIAFQAHLANRHDAGWCEALAKRLGLSEHLSKYPEQLSGGQQQRTAIGRALAHRPKLILADEPTGNLDEATGDSVLALMLELAAETGAALLMVTHSSRLARRLGRRLHLERGRLR